MNSAKPLMQALNATFARVDATQFQFRVSPFQNLNLLAPFPSTSSNDITTLQFAIQSTTTFRMDPSQLKDEAVADRVRAAAEFLDPSMLSFSKNTPPC